MPFPTLPPEPPAIVEPVVIPGEQAPTQGDSASSSLGGITAIPRPETTAATPPALGGRLPRNSPSAPPEPPASVPLTAADLALGTDAQSLGSPLAVGWQAIPPESSREPRLSQGSPVLSPLPRPTPPPGDATPGESPSDATPPAAPTAEDRFPLGAAPEAHWHNGGVTSTGTLLGPTAPTNDPDIPLDLTADFQVFNPEEQTITARGNVRLRVGNALLYADRLWVNLINRYVLAEGNVVFLRGDQRITGERLEYNLLQGSGNLIEAQGEIFLPTLGSDFENILPADASIAANRPITDRLRTTGPIQNVRPLGSVVLATGTLVTPGLEAGDLQRFRFQADRLNLDATGWTADEIRLTNDPFSPPELEFRGRSARLVRLTDEEDELEIEQARVVFDQGFSIPLVRSRIRFRREGVDENDLNPLPTGIGIDGRDRGGLFIERAFSLAVAPPWQLEVVPQVLVARLLGSGDVISPTNFGAIVNLTGQFGPTTQVAATANISGFDFQNFDNRIRSSVRVQQQLSSHQLNFEYSYRDRLFNGSLGFQDVQSSVGAVLISPNFVLGESGINLSYQVGAQYITASTDIPALLAVNPVNDFASLGRFQGSLALSRGFTLWQGQPLPATPEAGLRYSPVPLVPYIDLIVGGRGTLSYYTTGTTQESVTASLGLQGQFGGFSRNFFDYTQWNITYSKAFVGNTTSPFRFDRNVDQNTLSFGLIQQIYGPIRGGFQTSINLDSGAIISTDYVLEYSRRTYGFVFQINPQRATGFVGFRLSFFDWVGDSGDFTGRTVRNGVIYD